MSNVSILTSVTGLELSHFGLPYQVEDTTYISAYCNQIKGEHLLGRQILKTHF